MYRIAVLSDRAELAACFTEQINRFCMERGAFPAIACYQEQERFFCQIRKVVPTSVVIALLGIAGLNAVERLRQIAPTCGLIWCSDLDFSLQAFRLRAEYFMVLPVNEERIREGLAIWYEKRKQSSLAKNQF